MITYTVERQPLWPKVLFILFLVAGTTGYFLFPNEVKKLSEIQWAAKLNEIFPAQKIKEKTAALGNVAKAVQAEAEKPIFSASGKSAVWKGQYYVIINKQWILYRPDNTYSVNGVRTLFKDETADTLTAKLVAAPPKPQREPASLPVGGNVAEKLKEMQQSVDERDRTLKQLMNE